MGCGVRLQTLGRRLAFFCHMQQGLHVFQLRELQQCRHVSRRMQGVGHSVMCGWALCCSLLRRLFLFPTSKRQGGIDLGFRQRALSGSWLTTFSWIGRQGLDRKVPVPCCSSCRKVVSLPTFSETLPRIAGPNKAGLEVGIVCLVYSFAAPVYDFARRVRV